MQQTRLLRQQEDLHKQALQLGQELFAESGNRVMVGRQIARQEAKGGGFFAGLFNLARGEHAGRVGIDEQTQQDFGGIGRSAALAVAGIQGRKVKLGDDVDDEVSQMIGRQAIAQPNAGIESGRVIYGFELSTHAILWHRHQQGEIIPLRQTARL